MRKKILALALAAWVILWIFLTFRELFWKGCFYDYKKLIARSLEGKRSYVTGDRLYEFFTFCRSNLPESSTFDFAGLEEGSIDMTRAGYYLYPNLRKSDAEYILAYDAAGFKKSGYGLFARMDGDRYILRKR